MKKNLFAALIAAAMAIVLVGCEPPSSPQRVYKIGQEYELGNITVKVEDDSERERYILYYDNSDDGEINAFAFSFKYNNKSLSNSNEFAYSDNLDNTIEFDQDGYYWFYGERTFYVSYKNADAEIKQVIAEQACNISFSFGTFVYDNKDKLS